MAERRTEIPCRSLPNTRSLICGDRTHAAASVLINLEQLVAAYLANVNVSTAAANAFLRQVSPCVVFISLECFWFDLLLESASCTARDHVNVQLFLQQVPLLQQFVTMSWFDCLSTGSPRTGSVITPMAFCDPACTFLLNRT